MFSVAKFIIQVIRIKSKIVGFIEIYISLTSHKSLPTLCTLKCV